MLPFLEGNFSRWFANIDFTVVIHAVVQSKSDCISCLEGFPKKTCLIALGLRVSFSGPDPNNTIRDCRNRICCEHPFIF